MAKRTTLSLGEALPKLLEERQLNVLALSRLAGVSDSHLHRVITGQKRSSGHLAQDVARALGLAEDYFPETRAEFICHLVQTDARARDQLYDRLKRSSKPRNAY
jgi:transcriptional regulator with XRE-family HTH domain